MIRLNAASESSMANLKSRYRCQGFTTAQHSTQSNSSIHYPALMSTTRYTGVQLRSVTKAMCDGDILETYHRTLTPKA